MRKRSHAFTLVELLVVIGIISVLISILLPSLNRARQAANLVDCQARLRQMGQALQIYTVTNKGLLPWGSLQHSAAWTDNTLPNPSMQEEYWRWEFTLSEIMDKNLVGSNGLVQKLSGVFRDVDTIEPSDAARYITHYTANPRVLYQANVADNAPYLFTQTQPTPQTPTQPQDRTQRKIGNIRRPSDVFIIWDGPQILDQQYNSYELASAADKFGIDSTTGLCFGVPTSGVKYGRPILPGAISGTSGSTNGKSLQIKFNQDMKTAFYPGLDAWMTHFRFRHMKNTRLAALCVDGHVETREAGTVMDRDIFTNYK
ncbi:MAG: type II secretion system protein [Anaerolineae bacterium]|nr:type II secretion system protein [Phycisphaerae bacterium]